MIFLLSIELLKYTLGYDRKPKWKSKKLEIDRPDRRVQIFPFLFFFFFFFAQQTAPNETFTKSKEFRTFDGHGAIEVCEKQTGEALFSILIFLQRISRFFVTCILFFFFFLFLFNILANIRIDIDNYNYS